MTDHSDRDTSDSALISNETLMAFDFGLRRIGVAVGNRGLRTANAIDTLHSKSGPDYAAIGKLIDEWQPARLIVGAPLGLDGKPNDMSRAADRFARKLAHEFNLPIERIDERHSSVEAEDMIRTARRAGRKRRSRSADVDKLAAQVILSSWLNRHA
ncbi:MAG: Holliday junction resolvase RuvX [Gammaproteobacteria bacterium]